MATLPSKIVVEVRAGEVFGAICDVLSCAHEALDVIPEWHTEERDALRNAIQDLRNQVLKQFK